MDDKNYEVRICRLTYIYEYGKEINKNIRSFE
jgi:hypothetical protein